MKKISANALKNKINRIEKTKYTLDQLGISNNGIYDTYDFDESMNSSSLKELLQTRVNNIIQDGIFPPNETLVYYKCKINDKAITCAYPKIMYISIDQNEKISDNNLMPFMDTYIRVNKIPNEFKNIYILRYDGSLISFNKVYKNLIKFFGAEKYNRLVHCALKEMNKRYTIFNGTMYRIFTLPTAIILMDYDLYEEKITNK